MLLGEVIRCLEGVPAETVSEPGFTNPHSYRGYYELLAFEPCERSTAGEMLKLAKGAVGRTFQGYKGGDYTMDEETMCYLSEYGRSSNSTVGPVLLALVAKAAKETLLQRIDRKEAPR